MMSFQDRLDTTFAIDRDEVAGATLRGSNGSFPVAVQLSLAGYARPRPVWCDVDQRAGEIVARLLHETGGDVDAVRRRIETTMALERLRENTPVERAWTFALGLLLLEQGEWSQAASAFDVVIRLGASPADVAWARYRQARACFESASPHEALRLCIEGLRVCPASARDPLAGAVHLLAARIYREVGDRPRARRHLDRAGESAECGAVRLIEVDLLCDEGRQPVALVACREACEQIAQATDRVRSGMGPSLATAYRRWGEILFDLGRLSEGRRRIGEAAAVVRSGDWCERGRLLALSAMIEIEQGEEETGFRNLLEAERLLRRSQRLLPLAELLLQRGELIAIRSTDSSTRAAAREGLFESRWLFRRLGRSDAVRRCDLLLETYRLCAATKASHHKRLQVARRPPRVPRVRRLSRLGFLTSDPRILAALEPLESLARTTIPILILGESGTGKEVLARALHRAGGSRGPFVAVNCGALPTDLQESELFGHVRGAFTGAIAEKIGLFEAADGGTLLLDEIGEMAPRAQVKLLRVLELGEVRRIGETRSRQVTVRVLAATNADLKAQTGTGEFRCDLYHRLCGLKIDLPPLRDRLGDVPLLASHFVRLFNNGSGDGNGGTGSHPVVSPEALDELLRHCWPGNVRELRFTMEKAMALTQALGRDRLEADVIDYEPVADAARPAETPQSEEEIIVAGGLEAYIANTERRLIVKALEENGWNRTRAARALGGMSRTTLIGKMKRLGLFPGPGDEGAREVEEGE